MPLDGHLPDISPAGPLDELPKRSQKGRLCTEVLQICTADNLTPSSLVERMYVPCLQVCAPSQVFWISVECYPHFCRSTWCNPRYHQYEGKLLGSILDSPNECIRGRSEELGNSTTVTPAPFNKPNFGHRLALADGAWIDWPLWGRPGPTPHYYEIVTFSLSTRTRLMRIGQQLRSTNFRDRDINTVFFALRPGNIKLQPRNLPVELKLSSLRVPLEWIQVSFHTR